MLPGTRDLEVVSMCKFFVTSDLWNVEDPSSAAKLCEASSYARLWDAPLSSGADNTYTFPADSVLVMMGITANLVAASDSAFQAGVEWLSTADRQPLSIRYVRADLGTFSQTKTLIVIGGATVMAGIQFSNTWKVWTRLPNSGGDWAKQLRTNDDGTNRQLPWIVQWIKDNDSKDSVKV
jgi:hypothetical protein